MWVRVEGCVSKVMMKGRGWTEGKVVMFTTALFSVGSRRWGGSCSFGGRSRVTESPKEDNGEGPSPPLPPYPLDQVSRPPPSNPTDFRTTTIGLTLFKNSSSIQS